MTPASTPTETEVALIKLQLWGAFLLAIPSLDGPSVHLVGFNPATGRARVSSAVKVVMVRERRVITASGRIYEVLGKPGRAAFCLLALQGWAPAMKTVVVANVTRQLFDGARLAAGMAPVDLGYLH